MSDEVCDRQFFVRICSASFLRAVTSIKTDSDGNQRDVTAVHE
jgi:hypothetical protein